MFKFIINCKKDYAKLLTEKISKPNKKRGIIAKKVIQIVLFFILL